LIPKLREGTSQSNINKTKEIKPESREEKHQTGRSELLDDLLKPEHQQEQIDRALLKKKKRKRSSLHL
jgi:hypothetical protein